MNRDPTITGAVDFLVDQARMGVPNSRELILIEECQIYLRGVVDDLAEAVALLTTFEAMGQDVGIGECARCRRSNMDHTNDCKLAAFLKRHP